MKKIIKIFVISIIAVFTTTSCNEDDSSAVNVFDPPNAANLIIPENNTVCNEGTIISDTETEVLFQWEASENTVSYVLNINNLNDGSTRKISTLSTEFLIRILRGTPYSWSVRSIGLDGNTTEDSSVWSFYNAGVPLENHTPFPASAINPIPGSSIEAGQVILEWAASDIDNDISTYTILLDTLNPPVNEIMSTGGSSVEVSVTSGNLYYWQVITEDEVGNTSTSQVFQFAVN